MGFDSIDFQSVIFDNFRRTLLHGYHELVTSYLSVSELIACGPNVVSCTEKWFTMPLP